MIVLLSNFSDKRGERNSSSSSTSKKRKINDTDDDAASTSGNSRSKPADKPIFKVPDIPRKIRKVQTNAPPNEQISDDQNASQAKPNVDTHANASKTVHSPEIKALLNTIIENNTNKVTDFFQTLTEGMLHEFYDGVQPVQQWQHLQDQLITMQSDYTRQIDELKRENKALQHKLNTANEKYDIQLIKGRESMQKNAELKEILNETKLKMAATTMDLKKTILR